MNKGTALVGFLLSFLAGMGLMWGIDHDAPLQLSAEVAGTTAGEGHASSPIPITAEDPSWGKPDAPVTLVEISDFECPYCSRVTPTLARLKQEYGADKLRIVWKNNPLGSHEHARPAAEAGATVHALGGDFWRFNELAFANQRSLTAENFEKWAAASGVDAHAFKAAVDARKYAGKVDKDLELVGQLGMRGTPFFSINGLPLSGAQPYEKFKELIDQQLLAADALAKTGVARGNVSLALTKKNFTPAAKTPSKPPPAPPEDTSVWKVPVQANDPVKGSADALVTIVQFSDFQCPFCSRVEPTLQKVMAEYGNDVRIVWKDDPLPFHPRARPAATLARLAYAKGHDDGFWAAHAALFEGQKNLDDAALRAIASRLGLAPDKVAAAIEQDAYAAKLDESIDLASDFGVQSTPQFFINGRRLIGALPYEKFKQLIDAQLGEAKALVARGVARDKVFRELMKTAQAPAEPEKKVVPKPGRGNPFKGPENARIVIQEFSDFQCPYCSRVTPTVEQISKAHPNDVQVYWRHLPMSFHEHAALAAEAAQEAFAQGGNAGFWKYHDKLFANQKALERPQLEEYADALGLDMPRFRKALDEHTHKRQVDEDVRVASEAGITGTPGFTINGYFVSGAQPLALFEKTIKLALKAN